MNVLIKKATPAKSLQATCPISYPTLAKMQKKLRRQLILFVSAKTILVLTAVSYYGNSCPNLSSVFGMPSILGDPVHHRWFGITSVALRPFEEP